ncbi:MAG TPA: hypothetical protein VH107_15040, partial [Lacipirellulaceae bacterium]|nr:hypothetical protein [Lacipirellulaceae bacterium]
FTINYKHDANYDYWMNRAEFEQTPDALTARTRMYEGREAFRNADLPKAKQLYQEGFAKWRAVIDKFPAILDEDQTTGGDIVDFIKKYRQVLDQLDEKLGDDFPLWDVLEKFDSEQEFNAEMKEYRERHGKATAADKAKDAAAAAAAAAAAPAPAATTPAPAAAPKPATPEPESKDEKSSEKSAIAPTPAAPAEKNDTPKSDSEKK